MVGMENVRRRRREDRKDNLSEDSAFRWQAHGLQKSLEELGMADVVVNPQLEVRDAAFFANRRTLAFSGFNAEAITIVASSGSKKDDSSDRPISTLLILPTENGAGILKDKRTGNFYADSFWLCEDGAFTYVKTTEPIPLDVLDVTYNEKLGNSGMWSYTARHRELARVADDKRLTKELLKKAGLRVPEGIYLTRGDRDYTEQIDDFLIANPGKGIVVKPNSAMGGNGVGLFDGEDTQAIKDHARNLLEKGHPVHVEERIVPPRTDRLGTDSDEVDYNFRMLTTLDSDSPHVIDGEIRYAAMSSDPVNVSQGAGVARIDTLEDPELAARLNRVAESATRALCRQVLREDEQMFGLIGVDLAVDSEKNIYVFEENTISVGGFSTLVTLDKKPLEAVRDVLIPSATSTLEEGFQGRVPVSSDGLSEIPAGFKDKEHAYEGNMAIGEYESAQRILIELAGSLGGGNNKWFFKQFILVSNKLGTAEAGIAYANRLLREDPHEDARKLKAYMVEMQRRCDARQGSQ